MRRERAKPALARVWDRPWGRLEGGREKGREGEGREKGGREEEGERREKGGGCRRVHGLRTNEEGCLS